jgi:uncharacterized protein
MKLLSQENRLYFLLIIITIVAAIIFLAFLYYNLGNNSVVAISSNAEIQVNSTIINAEVVQTKEQLAKGLSGREKLTESQGMLFVLSNNIIPSFWMKEMNFPLDIIWINDNKIVDISQNVPIPDSSGYLPTFKPCCPSNFVLEVNAGFALKNNIKIGDGIIVNYLY